VIKAQGLSEAEAMRRKAEAWQEYTQAAILQFLIQNMPALAGAIAEPLAKTEKIVVISNSGEGGSTGATKITRDITELLSQMPEVVQSLTGVNLVEALKNLPGLKQTSTTATQDNPTETVTARADKNEPSPTSDQPPA
jgi:flotillin